jgi:hypothetical protein
MLARTDGRSRHPDERNARRGTVAAREGAAFSQLAGAGRAVESLHAAGLVRAAAARPFVQTGAARFERRTTIKSAAV